jgi:hypothetical protein
MKARITFLKTKEWPLCTKCCNLNCLFILFLHSRSINPFSQYIIFLISSAWKMWLLWLGCVWFRRPDQNLHSVVFWQTLGNTHAQMETDTSYLLLVLIIKSLEQNLSRHHSPKRHNCGPASRWIKNQAHKHWINKSVKVKPFTWTASRQLWQHQRRGCRCLQIVYFETGAMGTNLQERAQLCELHHRKSVLNSIIQDPNVSEADNPGWPFASPHT